MKKIISILFIVFSVFSFSDVVSGKRIQVRGTSTKELLPNSAKITLEIVTENDNLDKASKENSEMLEKYKNLLRKTNTKYEKINSSDYTTSENYWWDTEVQNKGEKEFRTTLTVEADSIDLNSLKDFMAALAGDKIYSLQRNVVGNHVFKIIEQDKTNKGAYQKALNTFNDLQKKLSSKGISANKIKIAGYNNEEVSMEKRTSVKKVKQKVSHTIEVTTRDMKSIGNIINLAHSLKIGSTGYIEYDIDNKQKLEDELYENAYREAAKKAQVMLNKTDLALKNPVTITDNSNGAIRPYYSYYNRNYATYDEKILKENDQNFINKLSENSIIINPQKISFSKTVYIEFEMD